MLLSDERREAEKFVDSASHWLSEAGFLLASHETGLNLGGEIWRFTSPNIDIEFIYEARDGLVVTAGGVGETTFTYEVWAVLLNLPYQPLADIDEQWGFFKSNINLLGRYAGDNQKRLTEQLLKTNGRLGDESLGLSPDSE